MILNPERRTLIIYDDPLDRLVKMIIMKINDILRKEFSHIELPPPLEGLGHYILDKEVEKKSGNLPISVEVLEWLDKYDFSIFFENGKIEFIELKTKKKKTKSLISIDFGKGELKIGGKLYKRLFKEFKKLTISFDYSKPLQQ